MKTVIAPTEYHYPATASLGFAVYSVHFMLLSALNWDQFIQ